MHKDPIVRLLKNPWLLAGAALDVIGLAVVVWSLPEGGFLLAVGVVCLLAGAALITRNAGVGEATPRPSPSSAASSWKLDPVLRQPLPRKTQLRVLGKLIAAIWICTLTALGWFAASRTVGLNPPVRSQTLIVNEGVSIDAEIHDRVERLNAHGETRYYLYYRYEYPQNSEVRASTAVTKTLYDRHQLYDVIQLKVLPSDPPAVVIPAFTRDPFALRGLILGAVIAALLLVYLDSQRRRHKRLVSKGLPVSAIVGNLNRRGASRSYRAEYRVGSTDYFIDVSERNPSRRAGNRVTVLHDPEAPADAVVYEASIYRSV
jgi:hypothetical protein